MENVPWHEEVRLCSAPLNISEFVCWNSQTKERVIDKILMKFSIIISPPHICYSCFLFLNLRLPYFVLSIYVDFPFCLYLSVLHIFCKNQVIWLNSPLLLFSCEFSFKFLFYFYLNFVSNSWCILFFALYILLFLRLAW